MKKILLYLLIFICVAFPVVSQAANNNTVSPQTKQAVKCYRDGNYTEAYQILSDYVAKCKNPDIYAEYYLALSAWKLNKLTLAKDYFNKVLEKNPQGVLRAYAKQANECLADYDSCMAGELSFNGDRAIQESELDKFIRRNTTVSFSKKVDSDFEQKHLDVLKFEINSTRDLDGYTFQKYKDYTKK